MSLSDRRVFLLSLSALAGCGFTPALAPGGPAEGLRGRIDVAAPSDEEGAALTRRLEERLGQPMRGDLDLTATIFISEQALGFQTDASISRFNVEGRVQWAIRRKSDGTRLLDGSEQNFTSYGTTSTTVATTFAQRDARRRLMIILADQITEAIVARADQL